MTGMNIQDYLEQGGKLTSPENVPPRYRGELMRLMASFVDSELAAAAGFADAINDAPGIRNRIAAAQIVQEKLANAGKVLAVMSEFGADTARYDNQHTWSARMDRHADLAAARHGGDMRLSVFHYPVQGWIDAVVLQFLMGLATDVQMSDMTRVSYAPLADAFRDIALREAHHTDMARQGLSLIVDTTEGRSQAGQSVGYWLPRVEAAFGQAGSQRFETLRKFGLRHSPNEDLRDAWRAKAADELAALKLN